MYYCKCISQGILYHDSTLSCPIKVNSNIIELTVLTSCYCVLDLLCVKQTEADIGKERTHTHSHTTHKPNEQTQKERTATNRDQKWNKIHEKNIGSEEKKDRKRN